MTPRHLALQSLRDKLRVATGPLPDETVAEVLYWLDPDAPNEDWPWRHWAERRVFEGRVMATLCIDGPGWPACKRYPDLRWPDRSLDGALRLVPKDFRLAKLEDMLMGRWDAELLEVHSKSGHSGGEWTYRIARASAPTAPLALLLAVVEARIVIEEDGQS